MAQKEFYKNAKIYKIVDNTNGNIYIGSTCKTLSQRLSKHRANYKQYLRGEYRNVKSFDIIANNDYDIVLLENCQNITTKDELHQRERHYIDTLECVNKCKPGKFNELGKKQYGKKYREENKEAIKKKKGTIITCPHCNCELVYNSKARHEKTKKHRDSIKNAPDTIIDI